VDPCAAPDVEGDPLRRQPTIEDVPRPEPLQHTVRLVEETPPLQPLRVVAEDRRVDVHPASMPDQDPPRQPDRWRRVTDSGSPAVRASDGCGVVSSTHTPVAAGANVRWNTICRSARTDESGTLGGDPLGE